MAKLSSTVFVATTNARLDALESAVLGRPRQRLSKADLAKAEGVTTRTIDRRVAAGTLPPSDNVINGRHFWWSDSLERFRSSSAKADTAEARQARNPKFKSRGNPAAPSPEV